MVVKDEHLRIRFCQIDKSTARNRLDHVGDAANGDGHFFTRHWVEAVILATIAGILRCRSKLTILLMSRFQSNPSRVQKTKGTDILALVEVCVGDRQRIQSYFL